MFSYSIILNILYIAHGSCSLNVHGRSVHCHPITQQPTLISFLNAPREIFVAQHWKNSYTHKRIPDFSSLIQQAISALFLNARQKKQPEGQLWSESES